jgi:serine/threonine protein kinase
VSIASSGHLVDALRQNELLNRQQLTELACRDDARCGEARNLAKLLVQRGWLTVYQANQLLLDRANDLVIGPYHVLDRLGQGGISAVYKARHAEHGWVVALKHLQPEAIADTAGRQQFLLEIEAMTRLDHPNIVQFCDADRVGESVYYAMEYIEGSDLGKYVRLLGRLPVGEACDYIRQAALGLQHAFERNLVHRDIKPMNLYLTHPSAAPTTPGLYHGYSATEKPKPTGPSVLTIIDWGLAILRKPGAPGSDEAAETGVLGTADYVSPEQARHANSVDIRADLYSLGCTFYYLLTGLPPFPTGSLMQKLIKHQNAEPEPIDTFRKDVPDEVKLILKRMMAKQPQKRFQTPAAVALSLLPFTRAVGPAQSRPACAFGSAAARASTPSPSDATPLPRGLGSFEPSLPRVAGAQKKAAEGGPPTARY